MSKVVTIIDHIGRYIVGEVVEETDATLKLKTPVILHVAPHPQTNQLQVQTFPLFFNEFVAKDSSSTNVWSFPKSAIIISDVVLEERLQAQYQGMATPPPVVPAGDPQVIKLFDE
jgi:hypothetical protein